LEQLVLERRSAAAAEWDIVFGPCELNPDLWRLLAAVLKPSGHVLWFRSAPAAGSAGPILPASFEVEATRSLIQAQRSELVILRRVEQG
jgi:hypothetical protein